MNTQLEKIRDVQKAAWNKSSVGWKKWDEVFMNFLQPVGDEMIKMLGLETHHHVLDIATGTGEPGLTISSILTKGQVTGTDISEEMLRVARENAQKKGINNFKTVSCHESDLPFPDNTFDAVTCRCGLMFFPDLHLAFNEMIRVLKPGGRICVAVWNSPEKNPWIATSMQTMITMLELKQPVPGGPGLFRCAQLGFLSGLFAECGLDNISESEVAGNLECNSINEYWSFITECASPIAFHTAPDDLKSKIKSTILEKLPVVNLDSGISLKSNAIVVSGCK